MNIKSVLFAVLVLNHSNELSASGNDPADRSRQHQKNHHESENHYPREQHHESTGELPYSPLHNPYLSGIGSPEIGSSGSVFDAHLFGSQSHLTFPQSPLFDAESYLSEPQSHQTVQESHRPVPESHLSDPQSWKPVQQSRGHVTKSRLPVPDYHPYNPQHWRNVPESSRTVPQFRQSVPQSHQSVPQSHRTVPQDHQYISQAHQSVPQSHSSAPQSARTVQQLQRLIPGFDRIASKSPGSAPQSRRPLRQFRQAVTESSRTVIESKESVSQSHSSVSGSHPCRQQSHDSGSNNENPDEIISYENRVLGVWRDSKKKVCKVSLLPTNINNVPTFRERIHMNIPSIVVDRGDLRFLVYTDNTGNIVGAEYAPSTGISLPSALDLSRFKNPVLYNPGKPTRIFRYEDRLFGVYHDRNGNLCGIGLVPINKIPTAAEIGHHKIITHLVHHEGLIFDLFIDQYGKIWGACLAS